MEKKAQVKGIKPRLTSLILMSLLTISVFVHISQCAPIDYCGVKEGDILTYAVEIKNATEPKTFEVVMSVVQVVDEISYVNLTVMRDSNDTDVQSRFDDQKRDAMWRYAIVNSTFEEFPFIITNLTEDVSAVFLAISITAFLPQAYIINTNRVNKMMNYSDEEDGAWMYGNWNDEGVLELFEIGLPKENNPTEFDTYHIELTANKFNLIDLLKSIPGFPIGMLLGIGGSAVALVVIRMKKYSRSNL